MEQAKVDKYLDHMAAMCEAGVELGEDDDSLLEDYKKFQVAFEMAEAIGADMSHAKELKAKLRALARSKK